MATHDAQPLAPPRVLTTVALAAVAVRLLYFAEHARSALFAVPVLDALHFDRFARALAGGSVPEALATGFRSPFYPLLLAPLYRLAGGLGIVAAQAVQHAAGVATAVAVALLGRRLFADDRAALASGVAWALAPVPLFFEGELLVESLFVACFAALLAAGAAARDATTGPARARWLMTTGLLLAIAVQLRPNAWLLLAALPWAVPPGRRLRSLPIALVAFAGLTAVLTLAQAPLTGGLRLLPASGGVNLYLGNRRDADGLVPRQDFAVTYAEEYRDSVEVFAERSVDRDFGAAVDPRSYWLARTWREVLADPGGRLALLGRKLVVLFWNGEVPNNRDFAFAARDETPLLRWLPARFGVLLALAAVGLAAGTRAAPRRWIVAVAALHGAGVVLFFVADRYRLPLAVPCAALAGGGAMALIEAARRGPSRRLVRLGVVAAAAVLLSFVDWTGARAEVPGPERDLYFRSIARAETGDAEGALADAERAAALDPAVPYHHLQVATAALALDRLDRARRALATASALAANEPRILNAEGVLLEREGDSETAYGRYRAALAVAPGYAPALSNAAWWEVVHGRDAEARRHLAALTAARDDARLLLARAELARRAGDGLASARLRDAARALDVRAVERLEKELAEAAAQRVRRQ